jgi:hypothetical protein
MSDNAAKVDYTDTESPLPTIVLTPDREARGDLSAAAGLAYD